MSKDVRVLCIGAAVQDVFLQGKIFKAHKDEDGDDVQEFELGSKNEIEGVTISVGGGATNAAVTFARAGLHAMYLGRIGHDEPGKIVLNMLHAEGIDTSLVKFSQDKGTGYSAILLAPNGERTVLTYRGASKQYELHDTDFHDTKTDWLYISSLSGDIDALKTALDYANSRGIKIAINPGKGEIAHFKQFTDLLKNVQILSLNRDEMSELFGGKTTEEILRSASKEVGMVLMTDGPNGSFATDGVHLFSAGMYEDVKVVDRLGAGDAFSSGFVCKIAEGESVEKALTYASANSTSVVSMIGAKTGILKQDVNVHDMPIEVTNL